MLALLALAAGVGAFVYVYGRLRQIRLATLEHAEGLARGASGAAQTLSRLIGLSADILQLLISPRTRASSSTQLPWLDDRMEGDETDEPW